MGLLSPYYRGRPHPWHGLEIGPDAPRVVTAYIEATPFDTVKYELDKTTGYIHVDRPQRSSARAPTLYGLIPRTYCGHRVAGLSAEHADRADEDPLDICVLSERPIDKTDITLNARVVGGLQMIDCGEADDKIIAVLEGDHLWGKVEDIDGVPDILVERLTHYFSTYKMIADKKSDVHIASCYGRDHAETVIQAAMADYSEEKWG